MRISEIYHFWYSHWHIKKSLNSWPLVKNVKFLMKCENRIMISCSLKMFSVESVKNAISFQKFLNLYNSVINVRVCYKCLRHFLSKMYIFIVIHLSLIPYKSEVKSSVYNKVAIKLVLGFLPSVELGMHNLFGWTASYSWLGHGGLQMTLQKWASGCWLHQSQYLCIYI